MHKGRYANFFITILLSLVWITNSNAASCSIPAEAQPEDVTNPDHVIGDGTPESCTSFAFVQAVAAGGVITFNCGPDPVTITLDQTAKVFNRVDNNSEIEVVIDGGNLVTLSGGGVRRILYMNTCDPDQIWTTSHCQDQNYPHLTVQNLTFAEGNSETETEYTGGGAIWVRGGRFKILNSRFVRNRCAATGPDVGGAAVRVFDQYRDLPVYVVDSIFGGSVEDANICSNGGGLSSIGVSYTVINSLFSHNRAIGWGGNPANPNTPGGGSGAAIYNDGNDFDLRVCGTAIHDNHANQHGGSIFFVSNNGAGDMYLENSGLWNNYLDHWLTDPGGISFLSGTKDPYVTNCYRSDNTTVPPSTTIDIDGNKAIGLPEVLHALETIAADITPELSQYARKFGDIDYDHRLEIADVITGLQILTGNAQ